MKSEKIAKLLSNLPTGVTYIGDPLDYNEASIMHMAAQRTRELQKVDQKLI